MPDAEAGWQDDLYWLTGQDGNGETFEAGLRLADDGSSLLFFEHLPDIPDNCPTSIDLGLFAMKIQVPAPGDATSVRLYLSPSPLDDEAGIFKYDTASGWYDYTGYASMSGDFTFFTMELTDGGYGDADGVANGEIVDPLGTGEALAEEVPPSSSSGGGGCFIRSAFR